MKCGKLIDLLREGNFVIPIYLFKLRDKFDLEFEDFIFLVYLTNIGSRFSFDPMKIANNLGYSLNDVMIKLDRLTKKNLLSVEIIKNEKGVMEEYISLEYFYSKISNLVVDEINSSDNSSKTINIYEIIEEEFGRPLSPMELEIIKAWLSSNISEEVIVEAVREASLNGVYNMSYIDKILFEWGKKGLKTKEAILKYKNKYKEEKGSSKKPQVFEYNWLDEEDE